jgi:hypothetical protein
MCDHGGGITSLTMSPVSPRRFYALFQCEGNGGVVHTDTADHPWSWQDGGDSPQGSGNLPRDISGLGYPGGVVADPAHVDTVYETFVDLFRRTPTSVLRSEDAGIHWSMVMTPTASPPLRTFTVGADLHEGTALVGRTADPNVPADRRFLSTDGRRAWRTATCPGDSRGQCPLFVVDNVFGVGASYAFTARGVFRFHGAGPAGARLDSATISPCPWVASSTSRPAGRPRTRSTCLRAARRTVSLGRCTAAATPAAPGGSSR